MKKTSLTSIQIPCGNQDLTNYQELSQRTYPIAQFLYFQQQHQELLRSLYSKWIIPYCKYHRIKVPSFEDFSIFCFEFTD